MDAASSFKTITNRMPHLELEDYYRLNELSVFNKDRITPDTNCGCFHCGLLFRGGQIADWITEFDGRQTALCPRCGIDAVLYSTKGLKVDMRILSLMFLEWFKEKQNDELINPIPIIDYFGYEDYLEKGVPFLEASEDAAETDFVAKIDLIPKALLERSEDLSEFGCNQIDCEYFSCDSDCDCHKDNYKSELETEEKEVIYGSIFKIEPNTFEDGTIREFKFIDLKGYYYPYVPWGGWDFSTLEEMYEQYEDSLRAILSSPWSNTLYLFINPEQKNIN